MSNKRKGQLVTSGEWATHLRPMLRRAFWKKERQAEAAFVRDETLADSSMPQEEGGAPGTPVDEPSPLAAARRGFVILLNGCSSSGKTTLAKALQEGAPDWQLLHVSLDAFRGMEPAGYWDPMRKAQWPERLAALCHAINATVKEHTRRGQNVIVDHVLSKEAWQHLEADMDAERIYLVRVHCALDVAETREARRPERAPGLARSQWASMHEGRDYDLDVDTSGRTTQSLAKDVLDWIREHPTPRAFAARRSARRLEAERACLHLFCGKAGAGKTTLATTIAAASSAILIAEDIWLVRLYGPMQSFDEYRTCSQRARAVVGPLVVDLLQRGLSVVLDYPANTRSMRAWLRSLGDAAGADHVLHYLMPTDDVCLARIDKRNAERPEGSYHLTRADFDHLASFFEVPEAGEGLRIEVHP